MAEPQSLDRDDALRELLATGFAHATTAISRMFRNELVTLAPTCLHSGTALDQVRARAVEGVGINVAVIGACSGCFAVTFGTSDAYRVAAYLLGNVGLGEESNIRMVESALAELGNITACAFLGATSTMLSETLWPAPPTTYLGHLAAFLADTVAITHGVAMAAASFECPGRQISGDFFFALPRSTADTLLQTLLAGRAGN